MIREKTIKSIFAVHSLGMQNHKAIDNMVKQNKKTMRVFVRKS